MSETVSTGLSAVAVGACVGAMTVVSAAYNGLTWLSDQAKRDMEELEAALDAPLERPTTAEARADLKERMEVLRTRAAATPSLRPFTESVARTAALHASPLGRFIEASEWSEISKRESDPRSYERITKRAAKRMTASNAVVVADTIIAAAKDAGFPCVARQSEKGETKTLVLEDKDGRALVADIVQSDDGPRVKLDMVGFGDGSCHHAMDSLLAGIKSRGVEFVGLKRRSHYRREGMPPPAKNQIEEENRASKQGNLASEKSRADLNRRRQNLTNRAVIRRG